MWKKILLKTLLSIIPQLLDLLLAEQIKRQEYIEGPLLFPGDERIGS